MLEFSLIKQDSLDSFNAFEDYTLNVSNNRIPVFLIIANNTNCNILRYFDRVTRFSRDFSFYI